MDIKIDIEDKNGCSMMWLEAGGPKQFEKLHNIDAMEVVVGLGDIRLRYTGDDLVVITNVGQEKKKTNVH